MTLAVDELTGNEIISNKNVDFVNRQRNHAMANEVFVCFPKRIRACSINDESWGKFSKCSCSELAGENTYAFSCSR
jgi:hypothetical protein